MNIHEILRQWIAAPDKELALFELGYENVIALIEFLVLEYQKTHWEH